MNDVAVKTPMLQCLLVITKQVGNHFLQMNEEIPEFPALKLRQKCSKKKKWRNSIIGLNLRLQNLIFSPDKNC